MKHAEPRGKAPEPGAISPLDRGLSLLVVALAGAACLYFLLHTARAVAFPYPLDYGEGPLLEQSLRLSRGENIYPNGLADYPFAIANYPPVYPSLLALIDKAFGPSFIAARALTLLAALSCAALIAATVRTITRDLRAAAIAAALFLASPYTVFWSTLVRIDLVALALSLGAILLVARRPEARSTPFGAAALLLAAALTRQSHLLAGPLAVAGALYAIRPSRAAAFLATLALSATMAVGSLHAATGGGFYLHTVTANANEYSLPLLRKFIGDLIEYATPILGLSAMYLARYLWRREPRDPRSVLLALYFGGTVLSSLTIGKVGSHVNYFLELVASTAILGGVIAATWGKLEAPRPRRATLALLGAQIALACGTAILRPENMVGKLRLRGEFAELAQVISAEPREILADETMGLLVISGHRLMLQPFELTQLSRQGLWDQSPVVADIRARRFGLVLLNDGPSNPDSWVKERWTPEMLSAIHEAYEATGALAGATLYRPRAACP